MTEQELTKNDENVYKILQLMKLQIHRKGDMCVDNFTGIVIRCMREVKKLKIPPKEKKTTVANMVLLLQKEYGSELLNYAIGDIENVIEDLYACGIVSIKKNCC